MKVKITDKNHKIRKSLDRINESNGNKFFDPDIDTIIVDELDLGNGRYGKTDDVKLNKSEIKKLYEAEEQPKYKDLEEFKKVAREYDQLFKDDLKADNIIGGKIDPYFKYTDEPGDKNEILNRPDLQIYEPNQRFNHVLKHLPLSIIRKEMFKAWSGIPSSLIAKFGEYDPNDDINRPPSEFIDHGGYHMSIVGGLGPVTTPAGLDKRTKAALDNFADDFIYTDKLSNIKNNPNIIMVKTMSKNGPVYKTINLKPIKAYIDQAIKLIGKFAGHLTAILSKLQVFFVTNVPTMATDGFRLFINPAFVHTLYIQGNHEGILYVLVHELYHNFLMHHTRMLIRYEEFRDGKAANIAQDLEINHLIEDTFPILKGQTVKQGGCWDPSTVGKSWEEIYKDREAMRNQMQQHAMNDVEDVEIADSSDEQREDNPEDYNDQGQSGDQGQPGGQGDQGQQGGQSGQQGGQGQGGQGQSGQQGGQQGDGDSQRITQADVQRIVEELNKQGHTDLVNKILGGSSNNSNFLTDNLIMNYEGSGTVALTTDEIQTMIDVMRSANEEGIASKIETLLSQGDEGSGQSGQGGGSGQQGQSGQSGQGDEQMGGEQEADPFSHLSDKQKAGANGMDSEQLQKEIDDLKAQGDEEGARQLEKMKANAENDFNKMQDEFGGRGQGQGMSAKEVMDEINRLEAAGQKEAADAIRQQIADSYNNAKRQAAKDNGTFNEDEQKMTDMQSSEVDNMLNKQSGNGPAQHQDGFDGTSKHTDHKDMLSPEQGDKILKNSKEQHEERNQNITDKQMGDYKDLKDTYDKHMTGSIGDTMKGILTKITASLKPAVNWKQRLGAFLKSNITPEGRRSWNKKALLRDAYIRRRRDTQDSGESILAIIDVSGSVFGDGDSSNKTLIQIVSELCSLAISCRVQFIYILPFSGGVYYDELQRINQSQMQRIAKNPKSFKLEIMGDGATNFNAAIESLNSSFVKRLKPNVVILFTDGGYPGQEKEIPPLPRIVSKNAFLWFILPMSNGEWSNKEFKAPYGQIIKVMPGKGEINESLKYSHRNEIRQQRAQQLYREKVKENPAYEYIHEGKFYDPSEFSPLNVDRIPFNRIEAYDEGKVKTSNSYVNDRIKLYRVLQDFQKLTESVAERENKGNTVYNKINENKDITVEDIQDAIRRSQELKNE